MVEETVYELNGFEDRNEYLNHLADEYDIDIDIVYNTADMLGEDEDFDGLVSMLSDIEAIY